MQIFCYKKKNLEMREEPNNFKVTKRKKNQEKKPVYKFSLFPNQTKQKYKILKTNKNSFFFLFSTLGFNSCSCVNQERRNNIFLSTINVLSR